MTFLDVSFNLYHFQTRPAQMVPNIDFNPEVVSNHKKSELQSDSSNHVITKLQLWRVSMVSTTHFWSFRMVVLGIPHSKRVLISWFDVQIYSHPSSKFHAHYCWFHGKLPPLSHPLAAPASRSLHWAAGPDDVPGIDLPSSLGQGPREAYHLATSAAPEACWFVGLYQPY